jgi:hypothetical protein
MDQIQRMTRLVPNAQIHCGIVEVDWQSSQMVKDFIKKHSNVTLVTTASEGNEWLTLSVLHDHCKYRWMDDQPILYLHTKGAFSTSLNSEIIPLWREWMEYFLLYRYEDGIQKLKEGYTTYGFDAWFTPRRKIMLQLGFKPVFRFFSGNYWLSTANAIRRISLDGIDMRQRHSAEGNFLCRIPRQRAFDAVQLINLPSILAGAYTNYNDNFRHFPKLMSKVNCLNEMRAALLAP